MSRPASATQGLENRQGLRSLSLRPEQPQDQAFLFELYASTRQEELDSWGWPPEMCSQFLQLQFQASQDHHTSFPTADFQIVLVDGRNAGRLVVNRGPQELRIVDIALLPKHRNAGIGSALLQGILSEASTTGKPVRLCVYKSNRAQRLYQRMGFVKTGETELYLDMESRASASTRPR